MATTTCIAMLRSVNVGGKHLPMADLRALVADLGMEDVRTYIQSGNVVFRSGVEPERLAGALEDGLRRATGLEVAVVLRTKEELGAVAGANPFLARGADISHLHTTFLAGRPAAPLLAALVGRPGGGDGPVAVGPDAFEVVGQEVYVHCPDGYGRTKLNNTFFEKALGVVATTRNWKTVMALLAMASA